MPRRPQAAATPAGPEGMGGGAERAAPVAPVGAGVAGTGGGGMGGAAGTAGSGGATCWLDEDARRLPRSVRRQPIHKCASSGAAALPRSLHEAAGLPPGTGLPQDAVRSTPTAPRTNARRRHLSAGRACPMALQDCQRARAASMASARSTASAPTVRRWARRLLPAAHRLSGERQRRLHGHRVVIRIVRVRRRRGSRAERREDKGVRADPDRDPRLVSRIPLRPPPDKPGSRSLRDHDEPDDAAATDVRRR